MPEELGAHLAVQLPTVLGRAAQLSSAVLAWAQASLPFCLELVYILLLKMARALWLLTG